MNLADFRVAIPGHLIAQTPLVRGQSRLLNLSVDPHTHLRMDNFDDLLTPDDLLVFNNTKVVKARLQGQKDSGGQAEILVERVDGIEALCQVRVSKGLKPNRKLLVAGEALTVLGREGEFYHLAFPIPVFEFLDAFGQVPLPPYIERNIQRDDEQNYQTVFADVPGAVAAPTAGLHFSAEMLNRYQSAGVEIGFVTLHVGAGTFQPVRVADLSLHNMHSERFSIDAEVVEKISACRKRGGRVIAVGTTVVRTLEAAAAQNSGLTPGAGETQLFITPGYEFQVVDALLTNFHLSESTLLMLVSAFAGYDKIMAAYEEAIALEYRFFSYGDAMFCTKAL